MGAGKSEWLIKEARRAEWARKNIVVFKPTVDTRYGTGKIVSHVKAEYPAIEVTDSWALVKALTCKEEVVGIDEAQFFDPGIVAVCQCLVALGVRVLVAGLDLDYLGRPFGSMPQLLALADKSIKLTAICSECGEEATRTQRLGDSTELVQIGAGEAYAARCLKHHTPSQQFDPSFYFTGVKDTFFEDKDFVQKIAAHLGLSVAERK